MCGQPRKVPKDWWTYCSTSSMEVSRIDFLWTMPALLIRIVGAPSCNDQKHSRIKFGPTYIFNNLRCSSFDLFRVAHVALVVEDTLLFRLVPIDLLRVQYGDVRVSHAISLCQQASQPLNTTCDDDDFLRQVYFTR
jgi:hypothetical protein